MLSRLSIIPRNKYTNIAVPRYPTRARYQVSAHCRQPHFLAFQSCLRRISSFLRIEPGEIDQSDDQRTREKRKNSLPSSPSNKRRRRRETKNERFTRIEGTGIHDFPAHGWIEISDKEALTFLHASTASNHRSRRNQPSSFSSNPSLRIPCKFYQRLTTLSTRMSYILLLYMYLH